MSSHQSLTNCHLKVSGFYSKTYWIFNVFHTVYKYCYSLYPIEEDEVVHEFATLCLASLSVDFICKAQIFDNDGLPSLIQLLSSPDPDVKKNSLETVFNLVQVTQTHP